jgi:hypothetical protein
MMRNRARRWSRSTTIGWGWLDGRVAVALDYANIAREGEDEELERLP